MIPVGRSDLPNFVSHVLRPIFMDNARPASRKTYLLILFWLFVLTLALLPRTLNLDVFYIRDELAIVPWTNEFTQAIWRGDLAGTLTASDYPGIPMFWGQAIFLTLKSFFGGGVEFGTDLANLAERRWVVGVFVTLQIVFAVWLVKQLFEWKTALFAAIFLALDPFSLTEARAVRLEMISDLFACLSILVYLLFWKRDQRRWLLLSGVLAGLGVSSKTSAGLIVPFIWLLLLLELLLPQADWWSKFRRVIGHGLLWAGAAIAAFFVIWPAMWVKPIEAINYIFAAGLLQASDQSVWHGEVFFWGQAIPNDPGLFFYPVALAFRTTPLTWLGSLSALIFVVWAFFKPTRLWQQLRDLITPARQKDSTQMAITAMLIVFVVLLLIELTFVLSKVDRFLLLIFPILNVISAAGFIFLIDWLTLRRQENGLPRRATAMFLGMTSLVLMFQLWTTVPAHPYYFTYWNPLVGGGAAAMETLPMGAGEGVDLAVNFLNDQPDAENKSLICGASQPWCDRIFEGETLRFATYSNGDWPQADYASLYISHLQRGRYPAEVAEFFLAQEPLYQADLLGATYMWVYEVPQIDRFAGPQNDLDGLARLHGYTLNPPENVVSGEILTATVWWTNYGAGPDSLIVRLVDESQFEWARAPIVPDAQYADLSPETRAVMSGTARLVIPPGIPPNRYFLKVAIEGGTQLSEFPLRGGTSKVTVMPGGDIFDDPNQFAIAQPVNQALAPEVTLLGYTPPDQVINFETLTWLTFYWQAQTQSLDYVVELLLVDDTGEAVARWQSQPGYNKYPMGQWQAGEIVQDVWALQVAPEVPSGTYDLTVKLLDPTQQLDPDLKVIIPDIEVRPQPLNFEMPLMQAEVQAQFDERLTLLGYDLYFDADGSGGGKFAPILYWQSQQDFQAAFDVQFIMREASTEQIVQQWQVPLGPTAEPQTVWVGNEVTNTAYQFDLGPINGQFVLDIALVPADDSTEFVPIQLADGTQTTFIRIDDVQNRIVVRAQ